MTTVSTATSSHYQNHSVDSYEAGYFSETGIYMQYLVELTWNRLKLNNATSASHCRLLDIGGGTGNFAQALIDRHESSSLQITVIEPFLDPNLESDESKKKRSLNFVKESAEAFLLEGNDDDIGQQWRKSYHKVLLKEVVHHFKPEQRVGIFRGIYKGIERVTSSEKNNNDNDDDDDVSLLVITRPQVEIDYPLWNAARNVWKENQPSASEFCNELKQAGFVDIQTSLEVYPCQISLNRWLSMIRGKFWSTFSNFTEDELEQGCQQIAANYQDRIDNDGLLHFEDRLIFISARKSEEIK